MSSSIKLAVGVPTYSGIANAKSIQNIKRPYTYIECLGHPVVAMARNYVLNEFLQSDCTHLLSLDGDIHFHPDVVEELLAQDLDIVGVAYARRSVPGFNVRFLEPKNIPYEPGKPLEVLALPLGMTLITKAPLARFIIEDPDCYCVHHNQKLYAFCECALNRETRGLECDGYNFSSKMKRQGEQIYCLPDLAVNHAGKSERLADTFVKNG